MKWLIFLFLTWFLTIKNGYSLEEFLKYIQEKGLYNIILMMKNKFGDDVAIEFCKFETKSPDDCTTVVKIYMTNPPANKCPRNPYQTLN